jgi:hypothetical protein
MKIVAIVGTYRKGGVVDTTVDEILAAAEEKGAETQKIYLIDQQIEFCTNCRTCTQPPGLKRGACIHDDDMAVILDAVEKADALVIGSPMNFGTVTALTKRFIERLVCFAHWPWGNGAPKIRDSRKPRSAVVVASSAAPAIIARFSSRMVKLLRDAAGLLGAKTVGVVFVGLAAGEKHQSIGRRTLEKARRLGQRLVQKAALPGS